MIVSMKKIYLLLFLCLSACSGILTPDFLLELKGQDTQKVLSKMGKPDAVRWESKAQMWSYWKNGCSSLIFFDENGVVQHVEQRGSCLF